MVRLSPTDVEVDHVGQPIIFRAEALNEDRTTRIPYNEAQKLVRGGRFRRESLRHPMAVPLRSLNRDTTRKLDSLASKVRNVMVPPPGPRAKFEVERNFALAAIKRAEAAVKSLKRKAGRYEAKRDYYHRMAVATEQRAGRDQRLLAKAREFIARSEQEGARLRYVQSQISQQLARANEALAKANINEQILVETRMAAGSLEGLGDWREELSGWREDLSGCACDQGLGFDLMSVVSPAIPKHGNIRLGPAEFEVSIPVTSQTGVPLPTHGESALKPTADLDAMVTPIQTVTTQELDKTPVPVDAEPAVVVPTAAPKKSMTPLLIGAGVLVVGAALLMKRK